jgi:hypothetical protein
LSSDVLAEFLGLLSFPFLIVFPKPDFAFSAVVGIKIKPSDKVF